MDALNYHNGKKPGKIQINCSKELNDELLKLAYTPGVALPCLEIAKNANNAYLYTTKPNLVAVISNGTAVLGLGNIGALASKPVMEGKCNLLKYVAGIDAIDVEINETDSKKIIEIIEKISITFGGINLEDIKAPECFEIENNLKNKLNIPIFHDDQHGTAIVVTTALLNAISLVNKQIENIKIVFSGAGAAAIATANFLISFGFKIENIYMFDSKGLIVDSVDEAKKKFNQKHKLNLKECLKNADVFIGLSKGNILNDEILEMNVNPIIFALANPEPEIDYYLAKKLRKDAIVATGRSDFPNQVNNLLAFPFIFRIALDLKILINEELKKNIVYAFLELMKNSITPDYIIPNALDSSLIYFIIKFVFNKFNKQIPIDYFDNLDYLIYNLNHSNLLFKPNKITVNNLVLKKIFENLINVKEIKQEFNKELIFIKDFDNIITTSEYILIFDEFQTKDVNLIKQLNNKFIGIVLKDKIYFNQNRRVWFALKLLENYEL